MPSIDFAEVKRMVNMQDLLVHYNVSMRCPNPARPEQLKGNCPLPTHKHDGKESFNVNLERNCWSCWSRSCLAGRDGKDGGVLDFARLMEGCSLFEAAAKIVQWFGAKPHAKDLKHGLVKREKTAEDTSLIDWLERGSSENISERPGAGGLPVRSDTSAKAEPVKYMQEVDRWFDSLISEPPDWQKVRNAVKARLIESYKNGRKEARTA